MKKLLLLAITVASSLSVVAQPAHTADTVGYVIGRTQGAEVKKMITERTSPEKLSDYQQQFLNGFKTILMSDTTNTGFLDGASVGMTVLRGVTNMERRNIKVNIQELYNSFEKTFVGENLPQKEIDNLNNKLREILEPLEKAYQAEQAAQQEKQNALLQQISDENLVKGKAFIDSLKQNDANIISTPSGLCYKIEKQGEGVKPTNEQSVDVIYTGRLIDGSVFDSSKGKPVNFPVRGVIQGFAEGLMLMPEGSKYTLYIPANLAYGMQAPPVIGPNQTLIFDVELVIVKDN